MSRLLTLVAGWKGYAAVAALCLVIGASGSWRVMTWRQEASDAKTATHTVQVVERRGKITFDVEMKFERLRLADAAATRKRQEGRFPSMSPLKWTMIIPCLAALCGCSTPPLVAPFPTPPAALMTPPPTLHSLPSARSKPRMTDNMTRSQTN